MRMGKVAIADATGAVATNIGLVGEVRDSRRGRRVDQTGGVARRSSWGSSRKLRSPAVKWCGSTTSAADVGAARKGRKASVAYASTRVSRASRAESVKR